MSTKEVRRRHNKGLTLRELSKMKVGTKRLLVSTHHKGYHHTDHFHNNKCWGITLSGERVAVVTEYCNCKVQDASKCTNNRDKGLRYANENCKKRCHGIVSNLDFWPIPKISHWGLENGWQKFTTPTVNDLSVINNVMKIPVWF